MTKQKKIIDDEHYVALVDNLVNAMKDSPHFKHVRHGNVPTIRSKDVRWAFHETMLGVVKDVSNRLKMEYPAILALKDYHSDLIDGDVNHQHPKNVYSELLKASGATDNKLHQLGFNLCMLTIPIDGEYPIKLVNAITSDNLYELTNLEERFVKTAVAILAYS